MKISYQMIIGFLFLFFLSSSYLYAVVGDQSGLHGFSTNVCYKENNRDAAFEDIYMLKWTGGNSSYHHVYVYEGWNKDSDLEVHGPFGFYGPEIKDIDDDGKCELVVYEGFGEYRWACGACWRVEVPFVYHYDGQENRFIDVTKEYGTELRKKRTERVLELIDEQEKSDPIFYKDYGGAGESSWFGAGKTAWAEYLQLNPNQDGVDYFFERTLGKFDYEYLVEIEFLLCERRYWNYEFCNSRPLTSIHKDKVPLRLDNEKLEIEPNIDPRRLSHHLEALGK